MTTISNATVLITGGASGIGLLLGTQLLARGAKQFVIWDINQAAITTVVAELTAKGHQVHGYMVDVTDVTQIQHTLDQMTASGITVDILVNNAGIVVGKPFHEHSHADIDNEAQSRAYRQYFVGGQLTSQPSHVGLLCQQVGGDGLVRIVAHRVGANQQCSASHHRHALLHRHGDVCWRALAHHPHPQTRPCGGPDCQRNPRQPHGIALAVDCQSIAVAPWDFAESLVRRDCGRVVRYLSHHGQIHRPHPLVI